MRARLSINDAVEDILDVNSEHVGNLYLKGLRRSFKFELQMVIDVTVHQLRVAKNVAIIVHIFHRYFISLIHVNDTVVKLFGALQ